MREKKGPEQQKSQSPKMERSEVPNDDRDSAILHEIWGLQKEHAEAVGDNKKTLARLEKYMKELMERTSSLEQKAAHMEEKLGNND